MKLANLKPGLTVYDVHSYTMGNTTARSVGTWHVRIISVDTEKQTVVASWNSNAPQTFYRGTWSKWRLKQPMLVKSGWGKRLATRAEIKAKAEERKP